MKKILLLGATGTTGKALTQKILSEISDCELTLFSRSAGSLKINDTRVSLISGDASSIEELRGAVKDKDIIYSVISGYELPKIAQNLVMVMSEEKISRLIFTGAVGIYNELPKSIGAQYNVDNETAQIPNRKAVDIIEASNLNYTILRPGFLRNGYENDYTITVKGDFAKGYVTTLSSVVKVGVEAMLDDSLYSRKSISITKDMTN